MSLVTLLRDNDSVCVSVCVQSVPQSRVAVADIWTLWCMLVEIPGPLPPRQTYHSPAGSPACEPLILPDRCSLAVLQEQQTNGRKRTLCTTDTWKENRTRMCLCLQYVPSGLSVRPSHVKVLQLLLMLEVRVAQAWRGMVPITSGNERDRFNPLGMSTYTCRQRGTVCKNVNSGRTRTKLYFCRGVFPHTHNLSYLQETCWRNKTIVCYSSNFLLSSLTILSTAF